MGTRQVYPVLKTIRPVRFRFAGVHASSPVRGYSVNMPGGPGTLAAALHQEEHWYIDVASQGHTIDEALANLAEAVELYLDEAAGSG